MPNLQRTAERPHNIGLLFHAYKGTEQPNFYLDRPFDIAPDGGTRYTVTDLAELVDTTSAALYAAGLRQGGRLAIIKDNHYDTVLVAAAAARIGALPAMISPTNSPEVLQTLLDRFQPQVILTSPGVLDRVAATGRMLTSRGSRVVVAGRGDVPEGATPLADLLGGEVPAAAPCGDDEPMICTHTSGTTGVPKLVVHSPNTMLGELAKLETRKIPFLSVRPQDAVATCISFVHGRAITWSSAQLGLPPSKVIIVSDPEPATAMPLLRLHQPTVMEASPNVFQFWEPSLDGNAAAFERVRAYLNTFDAIHPRTVGKFLHASERRMPVWGQVWGQSEVGPVCIGIYTRGRLRRSLRQGKPLTSNVGRPFPLLTRIRLSDPKTGKRVKRGEEGLILVKTPGRCLSYLGEADRHEEKRWDNGWWNSGDMGVRERFGSLRLVDREVDIIPGMSSIAIESLLLERIDDASEVIVLGVPGRGPVPVLSLMRGGMDPGRWQRITAGLPEMEEPVVINWEDFPRTGTWKVRRLELRQQLFNTKQTYGTGRWT